MRKCGLLPHTISGPRPNQRQHRNTRPGTEPARGRKEDRAGSSPVESTGRPARLSRRVSDPEKITKRRAQCETLTGSAPTTPGHIAIGGSSRMCSAAFGRNRFAERQDIGTLSGQWKPPDGPSQGQSSSPPCKRRNTQSPCKTPDGEPPHFWVTSSLVLQGE